MIKKHDLVLLAFLTPWGEPCEKMQQVLEEIDSEMSDTVSIVEIDFDESQDISTKYDILGTPTLVLIRDFIVLGKMLGYHPKEVITDFIRKHI